MILFSKRSRILSTFLLCTQLLASTWVPSSLAEPVLPSRIQPPFQLGAVQVSPEAGRLEQISIGSSPFSVILIQDAHAVPDAQRKIRDLILSFQKNYNISFVAAEGAASPFDVQFLKSFPDRGQLIRVLSEYEDRGELSGVAAAAILSPNEGAYFGIENWNLYEQGLAYYLKAMSKEGALLDRWNSLNKKIQTDKARKYSTALLSVDQRIDDFYENRIPLMEVLGDLEQIEKPATGTQLAFLLAESRGEGSASIHQAAVSLFQKIEKEMKQRPSSESRDLQFLNQKFQDFQTSRLSAREFVFDLLQRIQKNRMSISVPKELRRLASAEKKLRDIQGSRLFAELENYLETVFQTTLSGEPNPQETQSLHQSSKIMRHYKHLIQLELSAKEWSQIQTGMYEPKDSLLQELRTWDTSSHFDFYQNTIARDDALLDNFKRRLRIHKLSNPKVGIMVVGGFHAQSLIEKFEKEGISFALVMPSISSPEETNYRAQMRGEVSWKSYFRVEQGKISSSSAFFRAVRDKLLKIEVGSWNLEENKDFSFQRPTSTIQLLKLWRDQILRDLSDAGRLSRASKYTGFIDEILPNAHYSRQQILEQWTQNVDRFSTELQKLETKGELNEQSLLTVLKSFTITPVAISTVGSANQPKASLLLPASPSIELEKLQPQLTSPIIQRDVQSAISEKPVPVQVKTPAEPREVETNPAQLPFQPELFEERAEVRQTLPLWEKGMYSLLDVANRIWIAVKFWQERADIEVGIKQLRANLSKQRWKDASIQEALQAVLPYFIHRSQNALEFHEWLQRFEAEMAVLAQAIDEKQALKSWEFDAHHRIATFKTLVQLRLLQDPALEYEIEAGYRSRLIQKENIEGGFTKELRRHEKYFHLYQKGSYISTRVPLAIQALIVLKAGRRTGEILRLVAELQDVIGRNVLRADYFISNALPILVREASNAEELIDWLADFQIAAVEFAEELKADPEMLSSWSTYDQGRNTMPALLEFRVFNQKSDVIKFQKSEPLGRTFRRGFFRLIASTPARTELRGSHPRRPHIDDSAALATLKVEKMNAGLEVQQKKEALERKKPGRIQQFLKKFGIHIPDLRLLVRYWIARVKYWYAQENEIDYESSPEVVPHQLSAAAQNFIDQVKRLPPSERARFKAQLESRSKYKNMNPDERYLREQFELAESALRSRNITPPHDLLKRGVERKLLWFRVPLLDWIWALTQNKNIWQDAKLKNQGEKQVSEPLLAAFKQAGLFPRDLFDGETQIVRDLQDVQDRNLPLPAAIERYVTLLKPQPTPHILDPDTVFLLNDLAKEILEERAYDEAKFLEVLGYLANAAALSPVELAGNDREIVISTELGENRELYLRAEAGSEVIDPDRAALQTPEALIILTHVVRAIKASRSEVRIVPTSFRTRLSEAAQRVQQNLRQTMTDLTAKKPFQPRQKLRTQVPYEKASAVPAVSFPEETTELVRAFLTPQLTQRSFAQNSMVNIKMKPGFTHYPEAMLQNFDDWESPKRLIVWAEGAQVKILLSTIESIKPFSERQELRQAAVQAQPETPAGRSDLKSSARVAAEWLMPLRARFFPEARPENLDLDNVLNKDSIQPWLETVRDEMLRVSDQVLTEKALAGFVNESEMNHGKDFAALLGTIPHGSVLELEIPGRANWRDLVDAADTLMLTTGIQEMIFHVDRAFHKEFKFERHGYTNYEVIYGRNEIRLIKTDQFSRLPVSAPRIRVSRTETAATDPTLLFYSGKDASDRELHWDLQTPVQLLWAAALLLTQKDVAGFKWNNYRNEVRVLNQSVLSQTLQSVLNHLRAELRTRVAA